MRLTLRTTLAAVAASMLFSLPVRAADLGGNCCSDLEERIAALESETVRKGNRKIRLYISGQVSKALLWHDLDGLSGANKVRVIDNPMSPTMIRLGGDAKINEHWSVGFLWEYGFDHTTGDGLGAIGQTFAGDAQLRRSAVWAKTAVGTVTVGRWDMATNDIVALDTANTTIASQMLSLNPLWGYSGIGSLPIIGGNTLNPMPFADLRATLVRYDTPEVLGFTASASWAGGQTLSGDDAWDIALRYRGEVGDFRATAGVGYRVEKFAKGDAFGVGFFAGVPDQVTISGSGSLMHNPTGLFVTAAAAQQEHNLVFDTLLGGGDIFTWQVKAGIERRLLEFGATTVFGEYGQHQFKAAKIDSTFYGVGLVQKIEAADMDVFVDWKRYDTDLMSKTDINVIAGGARIRF